MTSPGDDLVEQFRQLPLAERKKASEGIQEASGLMDMDMKTRRLVWILVFVVLFVVALGALMVIWHSWSIGQTTTTGKGQNTVRTTTHPDVSAAWAVVSAVVAGIVGLLVPSPAGRGHARGD
jgi:hypothetical protein